MAFNLPPPVHRNEGERIVGPALPPHFFTMDEDDDDAQHHQHPYHQLNNLYAEELHQQGVEEQDEEDEEEDEEDYEEDALDDEEFEDEDEGGQENQECEQGLELDHRDNNNRVADNLLHIGNHLNGAMSTALDLSQPAGHAFISRNIEGAPDKQNVRDDWTEAATYALLQAWGDRYVQLNKGNLKQEDWEEVAQVVSTTSTSHKTDVQCKNRLDTLKKKYKVEKHKQSAIGCSDSKWPFYKQLDYVLNAPARRLGIPGAVDAGQPVKSALDREEFDGKMKREDEDMKTPNNTSTNSKSKESPDMTFSSPYAPGTDGTQSSRKRKFMDTPFRTLAKAITKFGEIYEKMEQSKQQQLMDLEKIRMEFTRDLEVQRMQLFLQTQVELAKMKHGSSDVDTTVSNLSG